MKTLRSCVSDFKTHCNNTMEEVQADNTICFKCLSSRLRSAENNIQIYQSKNHRRNMLAKKLRERVKESVASPKKSRAESKKEVIKMVYYFSESKNAGNKNGVYDAFPARIYVGRKYEYVVPLDFDGITPLMKISHRTEKQAFQYGNHIRTRKGMEWMPYPSFRRKKQ